MLSKEELEEYFYYDETSPSCLRWKVDRYCGKNKTIKLVSTHDNAGSWQKPHTNLGYWKINFKGGDGKICRASVHRVIYQMFYGNLLDSDIIDHINGNSSDNRIINLRKVSQKENCRNRKMQCNNSSGVMGITIRSKTGKDGQMKYTFEAYWSNSEGKMLYRSFSVAKHGKEGALIKAIEARSNGVNESGDYTDRHGGRK